MPRLKIESEKSLYPPIEVEIDGQVFSLQRVTQKMLMEIGRLDEEIPKGNLEAAWKRLEVLFGPNELFSKLDIFQVGEIINFVVRSIVMPEAGEKNGFRPAEEKLPS